VVHPVNDVTRILNKIGAEDPSAAAELLPLIYEELRHLARARMANERPNHTLQATALVHEAYLRLTESEQSSWANRAHFFSAAAEAMRRILIDHARRRQAFCHGGGHEHVPLDGFSIAAPAADDELIAVDEAVEKLSRRHPDKGELVKLKYFAGLTTAEAADLLGISEATAKRQWDYARAWLFREIKRQTAA
jgi:RNA polymerase sigma factor (TIGR02999 family)